MLSDLRKIKEKKEIKTVVWFKLFKRKRLFLGSEVVLSLILAALVVKIIVFPGRLAPKQRRSIAVLYFENLSNESALNWMQKGIVELLNAGLSRSQELYILDSQRLFDILNEMGKENRTNIDQASATEVARRAGIGTMVLGNIVKSGDNIRVQARIVDVETGEILRAEFADGKNDEDIFLIVADLTARIRAYLEIKTAGEKVDEEWLQNITTNSVEAYRCFVAGNEFLYRSDWEEAVTLFKKAVAIDPDFATSYVYLAAANWNLNDFKAMDSAYSHALRLRDKASPKEKLMIDLFGATKKGDSKQETFLAQKLLEYDPNSKFWTYMLGRGYYFSGQLEKAVEVWKVLAEKRWHWIWTYVYLGNAYLRLNRFDNAIAVYQTGLEIDSGFSSFMALISISFFLKGDVSKSDFYHERFLDEMKKSQHDTDGHYLRAGTNYLTRDMLKKARDCFLEGIIIRPKESALFSGLGQVYFSEREYKKAIQAFRKVLKIDPTLSQTHYRLGLCYEQLGDKETAINELNTFIEYQKEGTDVDNARRKLSQLK